MAAPLRRRLFLVWATWIWLAWIFSGDLPAALRIIPALSWQLLSPPWPAAWEAIQTLLHAVLGAALVALATLGAGGALMRLFGRAPGNSRLLALGAGIPALAALTQATGLLGLAHPPILTVAALIPAVAATPLLPRWGRQSERAVWTTPTLRPIVYAAAAAVGLAALGPAVAWDEIVYHLRAPSIYMLSHKIVPIPEIFLSYFPFSGEMLFLLAGNLGGDPAARLLHALFWFATALGAARLARGLWGNLAGGCALALVLTLPLGQTIAARAYAEFFLALPVMGALLILFESSPGKAGGKAPLAGWLAGAALGVKYLGAIYAVLLGGLLLFQRRGRLRPFLIFSLFAAASSGLWLARNALWTGNPIYPLIWGGLHWTPLDMAGWRDDAQALSFDLATLLTIPWRLLASGSGDGGISPLLPIGLAMALLARNWRSSRLWTLLGIMFAIWWISAPLPRYLMPVLVLLCALISGPLTGADSNLQAGHWVWRMTLIGLAGACLCGISSIEAKTRPYGVSLGKIPQREYLSDYFRPEGYCEVLRALEQTVPPWGRVYFLGHLHSYGLARRSWFEFLYTRPALYWWLSGADTPERIRIRARQAGLTHIVYQPLGAMAILAPHPERMQWTPATLRAYKKFWGYHVRERMRIKSWVIYQLSDSGIPPAAKDHVPGTEGTD